MTADASAISSSASSSRRKSPSKTLATPRTEKDDGPETLLFQARAKLRPVSHMPGSVPMGFSTSAESSSSSTSTSLLSKASGTSSETIGPVSSRPRMHRAMTNPLAVSYTPSDIFDATQGDGDESVAGPSSAVHESYPEDSELHPHISATATDTDREDGQEEGAEEHVVALHDFASANSTCLSFRAGQIIRVYNRDPSGWWDGEVDGARGWFPSNYVDEEGMTPVSSSSGHGDVGPHTPRDSTVDSVTGTFPSASAQRSHNVNMEQSPSHKVAEWPRSSEPPSQSTTLGDNSVQSSADSISIFEPIRQAIALLGNAVKAGRWPHFQPATACVISSVRSVLSATDCLTRGSATLRAFPVLAQLRKVVLSELSHLVTQSKRASAVSADQRPVPSEMAEMMKYADNVLAYTDRFLTATRECGVQASLLNSPASPKSLLASNYAESLLASQRGRQTSATLTVPGQPSLVAPSRRRQNSSGSSPENLPSSIDKQSMGAHGPSGAAPALPSTLTAQEALLRLKSYHDGLHSIVAAFVGHIHSITQDGHASSYMFLLDLTRASVNAVRNLLIIAESVHASEPLRAQQPKEMSRLWSARQALYEVISGLVAASRSVTMRTLNPASEADEAAAHEEEKSRLLAMGTQLLRTGQECAGAVRMCLGKPQASSLVFVVVSAGQNALDAEFVGKAIASNESEADEVDEYLTSSTEGDHGDGARSSVSAHSLLSLTHKASSLSLLKERYASATGESNQEGLQKLNAPLMTQRSFSDTTQNTSISRGAQSAPPRDSPLVTQNGRMTATESSGPTLLSVGTNGDVNGIGESSGLRIDPGNSLAPSAMSGAEPSRPSMDRRESAPAKFVDASLAVHDGTSGPLAPQMRDRSPSQPIRSLNGQTHASSKLGALEKGLFSPDYDPTDICFNAEGQVTGATLPALIEKLTPHDSTVQPAFSSAFCLCFRLITTPMELFEALVARFKLEAPADVQKDAQALGNWQTAKVFPVRIRVLNFFKMWLDVYWQPATDKVILQPLIDFIQTSMTHALARSGQMLAELAQKRLKVATDRRITLLNAVAARGPGSLKRMLSSDKLSSAAVAQGYIDVGGMYSASVFARAHGPSPPAPVASKSNLASLQKAHASQDWSGISISDLDPLEVARQLTIMESKAFCCILPEELLGQEFAKQKELSSAVHVKKMSTLTTHITGWITETILGETDHKKRSALVKWFIKLGERCLNLNNYNTLFAIQSALNASPISRLRKTWAGLPAKYHNLMEVQRKIIEHTRNFGVYRARLRETTAPALPFVGLFLTDLTFCHEGNAAMRPSPLARSKQLINFDKYVKLSRIISELQRFQVPFNLVEVPEFQYYISDVVLAKGSASSPEELYSRSLWLEPRQERDGSSSFTTSLANSPATPLSFNSVAMSPNTSSSSQLQQSQSGQGQSFTLNPAPSVAPPTDDLTPTARPSTPTSSSAIATLPAGFIDSLGASPKTALNISTTPTANTNNNNNSSSSSLLSSVPATSSVSSGKNGLSSLEFFSWK